MHRESVEPQRFVEAERDVEILNRLAGRALHEVVDAGDHDELAARPLDAPADVAVVRVRDVLDLGQIAAGQPHERRVGIGRLERALDRSGVHAVGQARVDRFEDPAVERHEMRNERDVHPELLLDLGLMPMREHSVRRDAAVHFGKVRALGRRLAGAGDPRLRVDDHARLHQASGDQRLQGKDGRRRVAPGIRDERRRRRAPSDSARSIRRSRVAPDPANADRSVRARPRCAGGTRPTDR